MAARPPTKLSEFTITVRDNDGKEHSWGLKASDLEDAAARACKKVCLRKATAKRTSGKPGEPGHFYPHVNGAWPFGGNSYYVEPKKGADAP
jgi:hypothetical protein